MSPPSIDELMQAASSGRTEAFGELALQVQDRLYRFALGQGLSRGQAGEATQETLLRAYKGRSQWRTGSSAMSWLYGIAMNVIREQRRKLKKAPLGLDVELPDVAGDPSTVEDDRTERLSVLGAALGQLPDRQREAVSCRYLRELSVHETAEIMGVAEGTVKAATAAGMKKLREIMDHLK